MSHPCMSWKAPVTTALSPSQAPNPVQPGSSLPLQDVQIFGQEAEITPPLAQALRGQRGGQPGSPLSAAGLEYSAPQSLQPFRSPS